MLIDDQLIKKYSLPFLSGPMSQQATIVRMELTKAFDEAVDNGLVSTNDHFYEMVTKLLSEQRDPLYYINHRNNSLLFDNNCYYKSFKKKDCFDMRNTQYTMISPQVKFPGIVEICMIDSDSFSIHYEYCDEFISIMRKIKAKYEKDIQLWKYTCNITSGSILDRAAETVARLLNAGFNTIVYDQKVIDKVQNADWEPVYSRWITYNVKKDCFVVQYEQDNESILSDVKKIHGYFYSYNTLYVKKTSFLDLYDFGKAYAYRYSDEAQKVMDQLRNNIIYIAEPLSIREQKYQERNIKPLEGIPDELYDD